MTRLLATRPNVQSTPLYFDGDHARCRNGAVVGPLRAPFGEVPYPLTDGRLTWTRDGVLIRGEENGADLVERVAPAAGPAAVKDFPATGTEAIPDGDRPVETAGLCRWPTPRAAMTAPSMIVLRMAEDIRTLIRQRGEGATVTHGDLYALGWKGAQTQAHGRAATRLATDPEPF